jgi:hypothetical protein
MGTVKDNPSSPPGPFEMTIPQPPAQRQTATPGDEPEADPHRAPDHMHDDNLLQRKKNVVFLGFFARRRLVNAL